MTYMVVGLRNRTHHLESSPFRKLQAIFGGWLISLMDVASAKRVYQRADGRAGRIFVDKNITSKAHCCG